MKISTRKMALAGILSAITLVLGSTPLGFITIPNGSGAITTLHIPTIIAGALGGPLVGGFTGLVFGAYSWVLFSAVLPNPLAIFLPRILIGVFSALVYAQLRKKNKILGAIVVGIVGTLVNTVGVLGLGYLFGLLTLPVILGILALNLPLEIILSAIIVGGILPPLDRGLKKGF